MSDTPEAQQPPAKRPWSRAAIPVIAAAIGGVLLVLFAWRLPPFDTGVQSTDNAYVRGYVTLISPKLDGYVSEVRVKDFMPVKAGEVLVVVDDRNYRQKVDQAQAGVGQAQAQDRVAREDLASVGVNRAALEAAVAQAEAALKLAQIDLANTRIAAPVDGEVGEVGVKVGQYVAPGTQLMGLVPQAVWITANFKETQMKDVRVGEPVRIRIDALPGTSLRGRVERIGPAAGSEFAVIKPDNATGNFTKVVQRLPVRIALEAGQAETARLRPGMSAVVSIDTRRR